MFSHIPNRSCQKTSKYPLCTKPGCADGFHFHVPKEDMEDTKKPPEDKKQLS